MVIKGGKYRDIPEECCFKCVWGAVRSGGGIECFNKKSQFYQKYRSRKEVCDEYTFGEKQICKRRS